MHVLVLDTAHLCKKSLCEAVYGAVICSGAQQIPLRGHYIRFDSLSYEYVDRSKDSENRMAMLMWLPLRGICYMGAVGVHL
jgi:hypothetical protein